MATEIERKFLVDHAAWQELKSRLDGKLYRQGYLPADDAAASIRVRLAGTTSRLTIKGPSEGIRRLEYEYDIPRAEAEEILDTLCRKPLIEKTRYRVEHRGLTWEIDEFHGENAGLILAEIELPSEDHPFDPPPWIDREVSEDPRYFNAYLSRRPYRSWTDGEEIP